MKVIGLEIKYMEYDFWNNGMWSFKTLSGEMVITSEKIFNKNKQIKLWKWV